MPKRRTKSLREIESQRYRIWLNLYNKMLNTPPRSLSNKREWNIYKKRQDRVNEAAKRYEENIKRTVAYHNDKKTFDNAVTYAYAVSTDRRDSAMDAARGAEFDLKNRQYPTSTYRDAAYRNKQPSVVSAPSIANDARASKENNSSNTSIASKGASVG